MYVFEFPLLGFSQSCVITFFHKRFNVVGFFKCLSNVKKQSKKEGKFQV